MRIHIWILLVASFFVLISSATPLLNYESIFNFGDSLSDTGNLLLSGDVPSPAFGKLPYGQTFFKRATGRCSDGRLVIDFIAEASGLPYLPPYLGLTQASGLPYLAPYIELTQENFKNFRRGVNFAVAGATALSPKFFEKKKLGRALWTNSSLNVQLGWFKKLKPSLCTSKQDCDAYFKKSLFFVGEIGGNDYNYPLLMGGNINQIQAIVPFVVEAIANATGALVEEGAMTLVVPGNLPIGCSAAFLTVFGKHNQSVYDCQNGCLERLNDLAKHHNNQLKQALDVLREKYPQAKIIYADYYGAAMRFYNAPLEYDFSGGVLKACCGGGGPYNFNSTVRCGHTKSTVCQDPSLQANWDGIHLTEAAYQKIANGILTGPFTTPSLVST